VALALLIGAPPDSGADETLATFTLDGFSFVSFEDEDVYPIPTGGALRFRFGAPSADGSVPFTLAPGDVDLPPIPVGDGRTLTYRLASATGGLVRRSGAGTLVVQFPATVTAELATAEGSGSVPYSLVFTTETTSAPDLDNQTRVTVEGMRLQAGPGAMQLVGAATSRANAFPGPGKAAYTVLSGRFDRLPALP
jgi:hypothetical protein